MRKYYKYLLFGEWKYKMCYIFLMKYCIIVNMREL